MCDVQHEPLFFENSPNKFFDGIAAGGRRSLTAAHGWSRAEGV
jgi:hypothetical protein